MNNQAGDVGNPFPPEEIDELANDPNIPITNWETFLEQCPAGNPVIHPDPYHNPLGLNNQAPHDPFARYDSVNNPFTVSSQIADPSAMDNLVNNP